MTNENIINELLDRAYEAEDIDKIEELVGQALKLDPDNPEALLLLADLTEEDEEKLVVLERALESVKLRLEEENVSEDDLPEDDMGMVYMALLQRLAFTLFSLEEDDRSLEVVEELLKYDYEELGTVKALYYRILLERREWAKVLEETMKDANRELAWAYSRAIATYMISQGKGAENAGIMLWDAVRMAPNVPFYMLGYFPEPLEETDQEDFHVALLFEDVWAASRDLLNWFSRATILFGLLSERFGAESDDMKEILDSLNGMRDYRELAERLDHEDVDDDRILTALVEGHYPRGR